MSELENGFRIGDVLAVVRRQWPVVVGAAVVGLIVGYLVFAGASESYEATARVKVNPIRLNQFDAERPATEVDTATEVDLVRSDPVVDAVRTELELSGENRAVRGRIVVAADESDVLRITFIGDTANQAARGANAAAQGYLDQRAADAAADRDSAVARLDEEIAAAQQALTEASAAVDAAPESERAAARAAETAAQNDLRTLQEQRSELNQFDPSTVGDLVQEASPPASATVSRKDQGLGVGVFGIFVAAGLGAAWFLDRRDTLGGGRRKITQLLPDASVRVIPGADGSNASPAEIDTAIDRMAVELVAGGAPGKAASALVVGAGMEPPVALAEELASSLAFAGIPALFVLAGSSDRELRHAQVIGSFADLVTAGASVAGPAGLPANAGEGSLGAGPMVTWLRPKGSAEAAGLLRRAVVDSLVTRAGRERFEAVVFVAPSPTRTAAGAALGQWVQRTALVVTGDERQQAEAAAAALADAEVRVTEVVWT